MLCFKKAHLTLFAMLIILRKIECRRMKKSKIVHQPPALVDFPSTKYLPSDSEVTVFLEQRENRTLEFSSSVGNTPLSITITACTSPIYWTLKANNSDIGNNTSTGIDTFNFRSIVGLYTLTLHSEKSSYAHVYITRTVELPLQILDESKERRLKLLKRRKRKKMTVRWDQSLVDPYATTYCLVINTRRPYDTLCSAQYDVNSSPQQDNKIFLGPQIPAMSDYKSKKKDSLAIPKILCTGNKTHYTLSNLQQDANYYFNVFAINGHTNLTYLHGSAVMKFDTHDRPISLKDGKLIAANLKKLDGKAVFTYKLGKRASGVLNFYVVPCGGIVDVTLKYSTHRSKKRIKGFGKMEIKSPTIGTKYHLKVLSFNRYDFGKASGVKILATTKSSKIPFPSLPAETIVHEYVSLRKCNSVTVGWYAAPASADVVYCIAAKKGKLPEVGDHRILDNCRTDYEMKSLGAKTYCKSFTEKSGEIIIERIENLNPGEAYIVYVTVKKKQGKSLSYDLLQVHTKPECD